MHKTWDGSTYPRSRLGCFNHWKNNLFTKIASRLIRDQFYKLMKPHYITQLIFWQTNSWNRCKECPDSLFWGPSGNSFDVAQQGSSCLRGEWYLTFQGSNRGEGGRATWHRGSVCVSYEAVSDSNLGALEIFRLLRHSKVHSLALVLGLLFCSTSLY